MSEEPVLKETEMESPGHRFIRLDQLKIREIYRTLVPLPTEQDLRGLKEDIHENGIRIPIDINPQKIILDGHCRYRLAKELGLKKVPFRVRKLHNELEEKAYILSIHRRRHFNNAQRAEYGLRWMELETERARDRQRLTWFVRKAVQKRDVVTPESSSPFIEKGKALEIAARRAGISKGTLHKALKIKGACDKDKEVSREWERALSGKTTIHSVFEIVKQKESQEEVKRYLSRHDELIRGLRRNIRLGDFRKIGREIPGNSISLIFTDPLYLTKDIRLYEDLAVLGKRVLIDGGSLVCYAVNRNLPTILKMMEEHLRWHSQIAVVQKGANQRNRDLFIYSAWKPLLWFTKGKRRDKTIVRDVISSARSEKGLHKFQ